MKMTSSCWLEAYLGWLGQRVEILHVIQPEPLPEVSEDKGAVLLDLEVAGQVLLVEGVVVDLHLRERPEVVRHEHHRDAHVLQLLEKNMGRIRLDRGEYFHQVSRLKTAFTFTVWLIPHMKTERTGSLARKSFLFGCFTWTERRNANGSCFTLNRLVFILAKELSISTASALSLFLLIFSQHHLFPPIFFLLLSFSEPSQCNSILQF